MQYGDSYFSSLVLIAVIVRFINFGQDRYKGAAACTEKVEWEIVKIEKR